MLQHAAYYDGTEASFVVPLVPPAALFGNRDHDGIIGFAYIAGESVD